MVRESITNKLEDKHQ